MKKINVPFFLFIEQKQKRSLIPNTQPLQTSPHGVGWGGGWDGGGVGWGKREDYINAHFSPS